MRRKPDPNFIRVEADEPPHLEEGNPSFLHEASYVPRSRMENLGNLDSVEKLWKLFATGGNGTPWAPDAHRSVSACAS